MTFLKRAGNLWLGALVITILLEVLMNGQGWLIAFLFPMISIPYLIIVAIIAGVLAMLRKNRERDGLVPAEKVRKSRVTLIIGLLPFMVLAAYLAFILIENSI